MFHLSFIQNFGQNLELIMNVFGLLNSNFSGLIFKLVKR